MVHLVTKSLIIGLVSTEQHLLVILLVCIVKIPLITKSLSKGLVSTEQNLLVILLVSVVKQSSNTVQLTTDNVIWFCMSDCGSLSCSLACQTTLLAKWLWCPPGERKIPGSSPAYAKIFPGSSHTSDIKNGTLVATLPGCLAL